MKAKDWKESFHSGLASSVAGRKRIVSTLVSGLLFFILSVLLSNPQYSIQMLGAGTEYWSIALMTRFYGLINSAGSIGALFTALFSLLAGVSLTNTLVQLKMNSISLNSLGAIPGLAAAGCASCGVGLLSFLGIGTALVSLPFSGNILRLSAVLLLVTLITRTGNPEKCSV